MDRLHQALRGAGHDGAPAANAAPRQTTLLVIGAGGALGSAVLAQALVAGRFRSVTALAAVPLASTVAGLRTITSPDLADLAEAPDCAIVVFDRARHSHGRDDAFVSPDPQVLLPLARALHQRGTRSLVLVTPHAPALLPQALAQGLASLDEAALAALGFEHLVILRAAQSARAQGAAGWAERVAALWWAQLRWLVPQHQAPLRAEALARCVVALARALPQAQPGTRVFSPETLWQWAQDEAQAAAGPAGLRSL